MARRLDAEQEGRDEERRRRQYKHGDPSGGYGGALDKMG